MRVGGLHDPSTTVTTSATLHVQTSRPPLHVEDLDDGDRRLELIDGGLLVGPDPTLHHQLLVARLQGLLQDAAPAGMLVLPGANLLERKREGDRLLIPDVLVVHRDALPVEDRLDVPLAAVEMVVEVLSPSSRTYDVVLKRQMYLEWAIPLYVIVDRQKQTTTRLSRLSKDGGPFTYDESEPSPTWDPALDRLFATDLLG